MHSDVAAVSVAVHQRVFRPASLVWANTATADHLLHIIRRELVVRRQTTLAGDHLRRKRTCGRIRYKDKQKPSPKTPLFPLLHRFRSCSLQMSCFKRVYVPFDTVFFHQNIHFTARRWGEEGGLRGEQEIRNDVRRVCVRALWQEVKGGCDWTAESSVPFWFHMAEVVWNFVGKRLHFTRVTVNTVATWR